MAIASLAAIIALALWPAVSYNPYVNLAPTVPRPESLLTIALLAVPAVTRAWLE